MDFIDNLLHQSIKSWALQQKPPDQDLERLIRQARFCNALLACRNQKLSTAKASAQDPPLIPPSLEQLLGPLSLVDNALPLPVPPSGRF